MSLRVQSCEAIAAIIRAGLPDLASDVEVIAAPPSKPAQYPACALLVDTSDYWLADDFVPVDAQNNPLIGTSATLDLPADWGRFDENTLIYNVGRATMRCRVFIATRHPSQRAEFEDRVFALFMQDDLAPGRILTDLVQPRVLGRTLPWSWPVAALLPESDQYSQWTKEYAFDERLWSWLKCDIEVDMLVPRSAPMIKQIVLAFDADVTQPVDPVTGSVTDVDQGADDEVVRVDQSGLISAYP